MLSQVIEWLIGLKQEVAKSTDNCMVCADKMAIFQVQTTLFTVVIFFETNLSLNMKKLYGEKQELNILIY